MGTDNLGPNGGVLYALEELEHNFEWLAEGLKELEGDYILFDCPGQVELYTHHNSLRNIFMKLQKMDFRVSFGRANISTCRKGSDRSAVGCSSPFRQFLPDPTVPVYLKYPPRPPSHDADGSPSHQRPYENRQSCRL